VICQKRHSRSGLFHINLLRDLADPAFIEMDYHLPGIFLFDDAKTFQELSDKLLLRRQVLGLHFSPPMAVRLQVQVIHDHLKMPFVDLGIIQPQALENDLLGF
jgi:hypothetical protein